MPLVSTSTWKGMTLPAKQEHVAKLHAQRKHLQQGRKTKQPAFLSKIGQLKFKSQQHRMIFMSLPKHWQKKFV